MCISDKLISVTELHQNSEPLCHRDVRYTVKIWNQTPSLFIFKHHVKRWCRSSFSFSKLKGHKYIKRSLIAPRLVWMSVLMPPTGRTFGQSCSSWERHHSQQDVTNWGKACVYYMVITELFFFSPFSSGLQAVVALFSCIKYIMVLTSVDTVRENEGNSHLYSPKKQTNKLKQGSKLKLTLNEWKSFLPSFLPPWNQRISHGRWSYLLHLRLSIFLPWLSCTI